MQHTISASGSPAEVRNAIGQQVRLARAQQPGAAKVLYAVRDHAFGLIADAGENDAVAVSAQVSIASTITPAEPEPAPAVEVADAE